MERHTGHTGLPHCTAPRRAKLRRRTTASAAVLLLMVAGCGPTERTPPGGSHPTAPGDHREQVCGDTAAGQTESDYATLAEELETLPAVTEIVAPTAAAPDGGGSEDFEVALDEDADEASLTDAEDTLDALLDAHSYPEGPPRIVLTSGAVTVRMHPDDRSDDDGCVAASDRPDLTVLPFLSALPRVDSARLEAHARMSIELADSTDLETWTLDAAEAWADVRTETGQDPGLEPHDLLVSAPAEGTSSESRSLRLELGGSGIEEAVSRVFRTAADAGVTLLRAELGDGTDGMEAVVETADVDDLPGIHAAFAAEYEDLPEGTLELRVDDGLRLSAALSEDDAGPALAALEDMAATGVEVTELTVDGTAFPRAAVIAASGDELRALGRVVSAHGWALGPDSEISVSRSDDSGSGAVFASAAWGEHAGTLARLWDAGFSAEMFRWGAPDTDLTIVVENSDGLDFTAAAGRDALVSALRGAGWEGTAQIELRDIASLSFTSAEDGAAEAAVFSESGAETRPRGWGAEFVEAWDASAE